MLSSVFPTLYDMSAGASHLIVAVLLFRFFVRKFPKKYILLLWAVVLFRLLCPLQPTSNLSMIPQESVSFARDTTLEERAEISVLSAADAALRAIGDAANGGLDTICIDLDRADAGVIEEGAETSGIPDTASPSDTAETTDTAPQFVSAYHDQVWLLFLEKIYPLGILVLLGYQIVSILRLRGHLRTAVPYPGAIPDGILPQGCEILYADSIPSAFVMGIFRPRIYLPSEGMSETAQDDPALLYVLAHEGVHLRRRDPLWKTLWFLALCLHWYNPLIWAAFFCVSADLEYRCDEDALRVLASVTAQPQDDLAAPYAEALLTLSTAKRRPLGMLYLDAGNVSGRIRRLLGSKPKRAMCVIMAVCCLFLCLMGIGNPPTKYPVDSIAACTLDGQQITPEHGSALVDALNGASRTVNRSYDAIGQGTLDHLAVVTYADGSFLEVNYLYVSGYSFNPAHPGEDDYQTVVWHRHPTGEVIGTWVMEYDFDAVFLEWMIASEQTPDHGDILVHAPSDSEVGIAVVMLDDRQTIDVPLLPVAYDRSVDYDRIPEITLRGDAVLRITGIGGNTLRVGEDYYEYRGSSSTYIDQGTFTLEAEKDGAFVLPITYRNPQRAESAVYYVAAEETRYCFKIRFVPSKVLTLDDVRTLSEKGMALTWEDFAGYKSTVTGSGLYIRIYEIDETFELWIGGGAPMGEPMYIYLALADDIDTRIDIRNGGVEEFVEKQTASNLNTVIDINDLSYTKVRFKHKDSNGQTIHAELKLALPNEWDIAYGFNAYEVIPFAEYAVIQNGEDAVGGVGFLPYSVPADQAEIREAIFNQIAMGAMSFWDIRGHFDVVTDQTTPYCTALTTVLYSSDLFNDRIDRKNSAIVTYHPEYQLYFAIQFNDGIQNRTLLTEDALRMIAQSIEWVIVRYSDTGNEETAQSALFQKTVTFLKDEFHRVYDPYYDILNLSIFDWTETGTEATFLYTMSFQYRDEQFSDLSPSESNIYFKVIENGDTIDLFCNVSPTDVKWEPCQIDDFVNHN
ncbi:MAG: M56 family metallopeptidase [Ruminococcaceae bacterium]|nr:M56 family metallopeptidase [Oscillospiraceae bacterium]